MNERSNDAYRGWEYAARGDYHRTLDPNWSYTPTYLRKMYHVLRLVARLPQTADIIDIGCGEGVLVEDLQRQGRKIVGLDLNYESAYVQRGDVRALPFPAGKFDAVLFLDALEHLAYTDQPAALREIRRVLRPDGQCIVSVPNLAHLNSRVSLFFQGRLDRTDIEINHTGERPLAENRQLLQDAGFTITRCIGTTFTMPFVYRRLICHHAAALRWLHDAMEPLAMLLPALAMSTLLICRPTTPTH